MLSNLADELPGRLLTMLLGMGIGASSTALIAWRKRRRERANILKGDARDTVVIHQHILVPVEASAGRPAGQALRIRSLGQAELRHVVPNGHLAGHLLRQTHHVTPLNTLISMEGAEGSYLLETLTNFVCDRVANEPFEHDLYVMAPCCEPAALVQHQPITILLIAVRDLPIFAHWTRCRELQVEHGGDGARILSLMELARRFQSEQEEIERRKAVGQRTQFLETMYILDLPLDRRSAGVATRPVPWGRYESQLKAMNLE